LLEDVDENEDVRSEIIDLIGNLGDHGERQGQSIVAQLTSTIKSSVVGSSQALFHRSLSDLRTRMSSFDGRLLR
jgi:hypothetical protein